MGTTLAKVHDELRKPIASVVLFSIAINLLALTVPLYMTQVFDRVLTSYSVETLVMLTVLALGLIGLFVALANLRGQLLTRAALRAEQALGAPLLAAAAQDQLTGRTDPILPLRDLAALRNFASSPVMAAFFDAPMVPLYVIVTFLVHPLLGARTALNSIAGQGPGAASSVAKLLGVIETDAGDQGDRRPADVGGVETAPQPDLDHRRVHPAAHEVEEADGRGHLKERQGALPGA